MPPKLEKGNYDINCYHKSLSNDVYMVDHLYQMLISVTPQKIKNKLSLGDIVILELFCDLFTIETDLHDI